MQVCFPHSSKRDEYSRDSEEGMLLGLCVVMLCRVTFGNLYHTDEVEPSKGAIHAARTGHSRTHHSVLGDSEKARGTYREFLLFDIGCVLP